MPAKYQPFMKVIAVHMINIGGDDVSYKIQYTPEKSYLYPQQVTKNHIKNSGWLYVAALIAAAVWIYFSGVPRFLIPGDPEITTTAASVLVDEIRDGVAVKEAMTTFCKMILDGAGVVY